jgi:HlyD family secretion protein
MKHRHALFVTALLALSPTLNIAQEVKPKPKAPVEKKEPVPGNHVAKSAPFKIEVELDALFTSGREYKISLIPKAWGDMTVLSALPHGTRVKKGDKLITIDTGKLEKAIKVMELGEPAAKLALKIAEAEVASLEETTPRQLNTTRRNKSIAEENRTYYESTGHPEAVRAVAKSIQYAQQSYEYSKEEFEQLKKMYEADDLTEETEEIVLRRAKNSFERATENLRLAKMRIARNLKILLPRQRVATKADTEAADINFSYTIQNLPRILEQKRYALEKARRDRATAIKNLKNLKADLVSFDIRSPADGMVYYGLSKRGNWITYATIAKKLIPGGKLAPREVFITIAGEGSLNLIAAVPEEKLANLKPGLSAIAVPLSNPSLNIKATTAHVNYIPGAFSVRFSSDIKNNRLFPGMKAKVKITAAEYENVITIPNNLIEGNSVWIMTDGKKQKKPVKKGPTNGKVTVILKGLNAGDKVTGK